MSDHRTASLHSAPVTLLTLLLALALNAIPLAGCDTTPKATPTDRPDHADGSQPAVLTIGTAASAPPFVFMDNGRIVGLEVDLANELARRLGRKPRVVSMFFPNLPYELRQERIDIIMAGLTVTPDRRREMAFTPPYLVTGQRAMVRADDRGRFTSADDLNRAGVRIAVETNSTGAAHARAAFTRAEVLSYSTLGRAARALRQGAVDAVVHDAPAIAWIVRHDRLRDLTPMPSLLTEEPIGWAVHPDNAALLTEVNAALEAMRADGTLDRLVTQWID